MTDHILLRRAESDDWCAMKKIRNSEFVLAFNCMEKLDDQKLKEMVKQDEANPHVWYIERQSDRKLVGAIYAGEDSLRYGVNSCEISYFLKEEYSGKGYMKEALTLALNKLFEEYDYISARAFQDNHASCHLLEKLGFKQEGILSDAIKGYGNKIHNDCLYVLKK